MKACGLLVALILVIGCGFYGPPIRSQAGSEPSTLPTPAEDEEEQQELDEP